MTWENTDRERVAQMGVWISTKRRGLAYHELADNQRQTICGRPTFRYGEIVDRETAQAAGMDACKHCSGESPRVEVRVSKRRPW